MSITWFTDSPDAGPACICSWCGKPILDPIDQEDHDEDGTDLDVPIRAWRDNGNLEARFHGACFQAALNARELEIH